MEWSRTLADQVVALVRANVDLDALDDPSTRRPTLLRGRSVRDQEFTKFADQVTPGLKGAIVLQDWYPPIWNAWGPTPAMVHRDKRCQVEAARDRISAVVSDGRLTFDTLAPELPTRGEWAPHARWVNVIRVEDRDIRDGAAPVIPVGIQDARQLLGSISSEDVWVGEEGIIVACKYEEMAQYWPLPSHETVMRAWFDSRGFATEPSDAGTTCREMLRTLGGPWGASSIANRDVIELLNGLAHAAVEVETASSRQDDGVSRARARVIGRSKLMQRLQAAYSVDARTAERHLSALVDRGVLRVGLMVRCPACTRSNFYPPEHIGDELECERCLRTFPFPASNPSTSKWGYRTQGPFAVENYAQGAYTVALSLSVLTTRAGSDATWIPGTILKSAEGAELEVDMAAWWRPWGLTNEAPELILGECKSFGPFKRKDISRARALARAFPGATLLFSTLRDALSPKEKVALGRLAAQGRAPYRQWEWRTPVVVLTAHELLGKRGMPFCWYELKDSHPHLQNLIDRHQGSRGLAAVTQELHLDLAHDATRARSPLDAT